MKILNIYILRAVGGR